MTEKKEEAKPNEDPKQKYVVLTRISYHSMEPKKQQYIDPYINEKGELDPYHKDAPRVTLEHLSEQERNLLVLRKVLAPDK